MALVVASCSSNNSCYDVFLSFRGEDTRYTFTDHLHRALESAGYHTFRDKEDLQRGENIESGLQYGIQNSKCSVIVFSKTYTSSRWCLGELVNIFEHKKTCLDYVVIPIFYDVDPSELRKQTRNSAEAFAIYEDQFKAEIGKVDRWREALKEAANLSGFNLQDEADRYEADFIEKIIHEVKNKLMSPKLSITPDLVGIHSKVPIEGISEHGIFNIFLPRNKFPKCFPLPPPPIKNFQFLNIAIVYAVNKMMYQYVGVNHPLIQVQNITKDLTWIYNPTFFGYPTDDDHLQDMIWLSHWNFGNHELEVGDEVVVSLRVDDVYCIKVNWRECRVHNVYYEVEEEKTRNQEDNYSNADTTRIVQGQEDQISNRRGRGLIYENQQEFYKDKKIKRIYYISGAPFLKTARNMFLYERKHSRYDIAKGVFGINKVMKSCKNEAEWNAYETGWKAYNDEQTLMEMEMERLRERLKDVLGINKFMNGWMDEFIANMSLIISKTYDRQPYMY